MEISEYMGRSPEDGEYVLTLSHFVSFHGEIASKGVMIKKKSFDKWEQQSGNISLLLGSF